MKKFNILYLFIFSLFAFMACTDEDEHTKLGNEDDITKPTLEQSLPQNFVVDEETNLSEKIGTWKWNKTDYGVQAAPVYTVEVSNNSSFEKSEIITSTSDNSVEVTYETVNSAASLFVKSSQEITLYFRLKTSLSSANAGPIFYSETKSVTFTCYYISPLPTEMYMTGTDFGNWNWDTPGTVKMTPVFGAKGAFWCIRYITANNGMKWSPDKDWGTAFGKEETNIGFTNDKDGNAVVATTGMYVICIDAANKKIAIEPAKVYGIGACFSGNWNANNNPFTIVGDKMTVTTLSSGDLRMYASSPTLDAVGSEWWQREFKLIAGKIVYRGDDPEITDSSPANANAKVTIDFNAESGTIQ